MRQSTNTSFTTTRASVLFYRAALPLSPKTLTFVSGIIRRHQISIGSPWRKLNPGQQALLVLVYLRKGAASPSHERCHTGTTQAATSG